MKKDELDGCDVVPHCLDCPLVQCKYDNKEPYLLWKLERQDKAIALLAEMLDTREAIAKAAGVSQRTVYRSLRRFAS